MTLIPRALRPGNQVAVIAPSGAVEQEQLAACTAMLEESGFKARFCPGLTDRRGDLAGLSDEANARAFMQAFLDKNIAAVICARGGYGCMRILPYIDWSRLLANPKIFIGFSDITALHTAIYRQTGMVTFHGGPLPRSLSSEQSHIWNMRSFLAAISSIEPPGTIGSPPDGPRVETLVPGVAEGILKGGNLTLLAALCGTRWQPDCNGCILLLEEVNEEPYRIDRCLTQLLLAGVFRGLSGIIFGDSLSCENLAKPDSRTLKEVIIDRLGALNIPMIYGFPCGHTEYRATLPLGLPAILDADAGTITFTQPALR